MLVQATLFAMVHWIGAHGGVALQVLIITLFGGMLLAILDIPGGCTIWNGWMSWSCGRTATTVCEQMPEGGAVCSSASLPAARPILDKFTAAKAPRRPIRVD